MEITIFCFVRKYHYACTWDFYKLRTFYTAQQVLWTRSKFLQNSWNNISQTFWQFIFSSKIFPVLWQDHILENLLLYFFWNQWADLNQNIKECWSFQVRKIYTWYVMVKTSLVQVTINYSCNLKLLNLEKANCI